MNLLRLVLNILVVWECSRIVHQKTGLIVKCTKYFLLYFTFLCNCSQLNWFFTTNDSLKLHFYYYKSSLTTLKLRKQHDISFSCDVNWIFCMLRTCQNWNLLFPKSTLKFSLTNISVKNMPQCSSQRTSEQRLSYTLTKSVTCKVCGHKG